MDADTGQELLVLKGERHPFQSICFSPDGSWLAGAGANDKVACVWDAGTGQELLRFKGHTHWVYFVCFSPDGSRLATASADQTARVWDAAHGPGTAHSQRAHRLSHKCLL